MPTETLCNGQLQIPCILLYHPRHEPRVGVRFTGRDKLVHLIGKGEVALRLERSFADHWRRSTGEIGQDFTHGNPTVVFRFLSG